MTTRAILWTISGSAAVLAVIAAFSERRRAKRRDIDNVGWVPWTLVQVCAMGVAAVCAGYAIKLH